jgi:hypothetical protein
MKKMADEIRTPFPSLTPPTKCKAGRKEPTADGNDDIEPGKDKIAGKERR